MSIQLQEAVTTAHETADAFSDEVLKENAIFQYAKESEMRELLLILAEGQIEMYRAVCSKFHMPTNPNANADVIGVRGVGQGDSCPSADSG